MVVGLDVDLAAVAEGDAFLDASLGAGEDGFEGLAAGDLALLTGVGFLAAEADFELLFCLVSGFLAAGLETSFLEDASSLVLACSSS